jgi:type I restriction enzyme S subunit
MQKIFSQEIRFKDDNGNDFADWEEKKLGEVFKERSERGFADSELLSVTLSEGVIRRADIEGKDNSSADKSNYKRVCFGDIAYNSMRMWQGASGVSAFDGIVSPAYTVLIPRKNSYSKYFGYLFKTTKLINIFQRNSQGLTSDTWNLKYHQLSTIKLVIPSVLEQEKITKFLSAIDDKINLVNQQLERTRNFKKGLLQQMFV